MLVGLLFHIVFTTISIIYLNNQLKSHRAALIALAHALRLLAEKKVSEDGQWN